MHRKMFEDLARLCQIDWRVCTTEQRGSLNQTEKILRCEAQAVRGDFGRFEKWWYQFDWRGRQGQPPRPHQVREMWGQFLSWQKAPIAQVQKFHLVRVGTDATF